MFQLNLFKRQKDTLYFVAPTLFVVNATAVNLSIITSLLYIVVYTSVRFCINNKNAHQNTKQRKSKLQTNGLVFSPFLLSFYI